MRKNTKLLSELLAKRDAQISETKAVGLFVQSLIDRGEIIDSS